MAGRQIRRGTAAERNALGGLAAGELGFETDTEDVYIGAAAGDELISDKSARDFLNGQDQAVKTTSSPVFTAVRIVGSGAPLYNIAIAPGSFAAITTGHHNTQFGIYGFGNLTTGNDNCAFGYSALGIVTTGYQNAAFGGSVLGANTIGYNNCGFGKYTLDNNVDGISNCAFGIYALEANISGQSNSAFGMGALAWNLASGNCAFGQGGLYANTTGTLNVAVGKDALCANVTGTSSVAVGHSALIKSTSSGNVAIGSSALREQVGGANNCGIGTNSLLSNSSGNWNTAVGDNSLYTTTGSNNSAFGKEALYALGAANGCVAVGCKAGRWETGSNKLFIDNAPRTDEADGRIKALVYGVFDAASANQRLRINGRLGVTHLPNYANNAAAVAGGLISGELYTVTATDPLQVAAVV